MKFNLEKLRLEMRKKLPAWINLQNLVFLSVITSFAIIVIWSEDISQFLSAVRISDVRVTTTPTVLPGTPTPLPAEWLTSAEQTNGIIFGAIIILLAILAGTIVILIRDRQK